MRAYFTLIVLIAASLFLWYLDILVGSVVELQHSQTTQAGISQAFVSAEAGLEYYRWHLSRFPSDLSDGTGHGGSYTHAISGATTTPLGTFSLSVNGDVYCGTTTAVAITSTGMSADGTIARTVFARYARPSVARYAYIAAPELDTAAETAFLPTLKTYAQGGGIYLPANAGYGYKIVFDPDGSMTAYAVTAVTPVWGYSAANGWQKEGSVISSLDPGTRYPIPATCPLIFVSAPVWTEGTVSGKVALVSSADVFLTGNITYENASGDALTVIGGGNILISLQAPDIMQVRGVYTALSGMFGRNEYLASGTHAVPASLSSSVTRTSFSVYGTVASSASSTVKWSDTDGHFMSGYAQDSFIVDESLAKYPPPFAPATATAPRFVYWTQLN